MEDVEKQKVRWLERLEVVRAAAPLSEKARSQVLDFLETLRKEKPPYLIAGREIGLSLGISRQQSATLLVDEASMPIVLELMGIQQKNKTTVPTMHGWLKDGAEEAHRYHNRAQVSRMLGIPEDHVGLRNLWSEIQGAERSGMECRLSDGTLLPILVDPRRSFDEGCLVAASVVPWIGERLKSSVSNTREWHDRAYFLRDTPAKAAVVSAFVRLSKGVRHGDVVRASGQVFKVADGPDDTLLVHRASAKDFRAFIWRIEEARIAHSKPKAGSVAAADLAEWMNTVPDDDRFVRVWTAMKEFYGTTDNLDGVEVLATATGLPGVKRTYEKLEVEPELEETLSLSM